MSGTVTLGAGDALVVPLPVALAAAASEPLAVGEPLRDEVGDTVTAAGGAARAEKTVTPR
jgi:hypothetical protein